MLAAVVCAGLALFLSGCGSAREGRELAGRKGCLACHTVDGRSSSGPTFAGLAGSTRRVVVDGEVRSLVADAEYLRLAIRDPQAQIVEGSTSQMPDRYDGLSESEVDALIAFIESLR